MMKYVLIIQKFHRAKPEFHWYNCGIFVCPLLPPASKWPLLKCPYSSAPLVNKVNPVVYFDTPTKNLLQVFSFVDTHRHHWMRSITIS